ncbi:MAG: response regulator [Pseudomonadota bacterium]
MDDEPRILEGLERHFRRRYNVLTATSGAKGLDLLTAHKDLAVIISDMRMPEMDGATFLRHARVIRPNTVRILLTGHADMSAAISAINEGQIFRFLTKPCEPAHLLAAVEEGARQHELVTAERVLLQRTVLGCIRAIVDVVALANPRIAGQSVRLARRVGVVAKHLQLPNRWQVEAAALLSRIGRLSLDISATQPDVDEDLLSDEERERITRSAAALNRVIASIPRMAPVARIMELAASETPSAEIDQELVAAVELLRTALTVERREAGGFTPAETLAKLRQERAATPLLLDAFEQSFQQASADAAPAAVTAAELQLGMVIQEDVFNQRGVLVAPRGSDVTDSVREHLQSLAAVLAKPTIAVLRPQAPAA